MFKKEEVHLEVPRDYFCPFSSYPAFTHISDKCIVLQGKSREAGAKKGQKLPHNSDSPKLDWIQNHHHADGLAFVACCF